MRQTFSSRAGGIEFLNSDREKCRSKLKGREQIFESPILVVEIGSLESVPEGRNVYRKRGTKIQEAPAGRNGRVSVRKHKDQSGRIEEHFAPLGLAIVRRG